MTFECSDVWESQPLCAVTESIRMICWGGWQSKFFWNHRTPWKQPRSWGLFSWFSDLFYQADLLRCQLKWPPHMGIWELFSYWSRTAHTLPGHYILQQRMATRTSSHLDCSCVCFLCFTVVSCNWFRYWMFQMVFSVLNGYRLANSFNKACIPWT